MPLYSFEGKSPRIHPSAFVAPTASIVGDVVIEAHASVWYGAVIRADFAPAVVGEGANVQDNSVLHAPPEMPVYVGAGATVAHCCVVHGADLGERCLIANCASVLDGASVGAGSLVAAGSLVKPGERVPEGVVVMGVPATITGPVAGSPAERWIHANPSAYRDLGRRHQDTVRLIDA